MFHTIVIHMIHFIVVEGVRRSLKLPKVFGILNQLDSIQLPYGIPLPNVVAGLICLPLIYWKHWIFIPIVSCIQYWYLRHFKILRGKVRMLIFLVSICEFTSKYVSIIFSPFFIRNRNLLVHHLPECSLNLLKML